MISNEGPLPLLHNRCIHCTGYGGHALTTKEIDEIRSLLVICESEEIFRPCESCDSTGMETTRRILEYRRAKPSRHLYDATWCPDIDNECRWDSAPASEHRQPIPTK